MKKFIHYVMMIIIIFGKALIRNNVKECNKNGIRLDSSDNNTLIENNVTNCKKEGYFLFLSVNNILSKNIASNNSHGFVLDGSDNNTIIKNYAINNRNYGIYHFYSNNNVILENSLYNNSLLIIGDLLEYYLQVEIENNTINDLPILIIENEQNMKYENDHFGQIIFINCDDIQKTNNSFSGTLETAFCNNIDIKNNKFNNTYTGVFLSNTRDSLIYNNTITNDVDGLILSESNNNNIERNIVTNNYRYGICLYESSFNILRYNNITYNTNYGLFIKNFAFYSYKNQIYLNNFIGNNDGNTQAYSDSYSIWSLNKIGNYWSDYTGKDTDEDGIGDIAYHIDSDKDKYNEEQDSYPLMRSYEHYKIKKSSSFLFMTFFLCLLTLSIFKRKFK